MKNLLPMQGKQCHFFHALASEYLISVLKFQAFTLKLEFIVSGHQICGQQACIMSGPRNNLYGLAIGFVNKPNRTGS